MPISAAAGANRESALPAASGTGPLGQAMELEQQCDRRAVGRRVRNVVDALEPRAEYLLPRIEEPSLAVLERCKRELHKVPGLRKAPCVTRRFIGRQQGFDKVDMIIEQAGNSGGVQKLRTAKMLPQDAVQACD
jgi:hypothetical protein